MTTALLIFVNSYYSSRTNAGEISGLTVRNGLFFDAKFFSETRITVRGSKEDNA